ncbi:heparin-binding EGF-like growth factor a isoform X1 [Gadus chalcogrammus]|uniref:heparin-binding EGF-like growth factor a isoform X1 n=1 Tax=Gadus chalcogrammus TaxID=1042646 RepID=UPI0024C4D4B7|nr:heparin-binding EGF-like growth factor a isoform X1 [Gadus chalcogrammus]
MRIFRIALLLVHAFVASRLTSGAAVDRHDSERHHTAVINLLDTRNDRIEEDNAGVARTTADYDNSYYYEENYYNEEEDYDMSGDVDLPRVAMSSKPKDSASILSAEQPERPQRRGKGKKKGKGQGRKRNPCLKKYKNFCIHGTCQYYKDLRAASCVCLPSYSGERCQFFTLSVGVKPEEGFSRTTALAVVAVVLSTLCLTIIGLLLALRFHKRGAYDIENEEKVKLGSAPHH